MSERQPSFGYLGIAGSPRKGGNTETLVDAVLAGAEEAGATDRKGPAARPGDRPLPGLRRLPADRRVRARG